MRAMVMLMLLACHAWANSLLIVAPKYQMLAGDTIRLSVVVFGQDGVAIPINRAVDWSGSDNSIATIASDGIVTALSLGIVKIRATSDGMVDETFLQILPESIRVTPAGAILNIGSTTQYRAEVLDKQGHAIPNVPLQWSLRYTGATEATSQIGSISQAGLLMPLASGRALVRAQFAYANPAHEMTPVVYGTTEVVIATPKQYSLSEVPIPAGITHTARISGKRANIAYTSERGIIFTAGLDGVTGALIQVNNGSSQVIRTQGIPSLVPGSYVAQQTTLVSNSQGLILCAEESGSGPSVVMISGDRQDTIAIVNTIVGNSAALWAPGINTNSLSANGQVAVRSNYRPLTEPNRFPHGIFRGFQGKLTDTVITSDDKIADFTGAFQVDTAYGIADDSTVYFTLSQGSRKFLYRRSPEGILTRLIGTDSVIDDRTILSISSGANDTPPLRVSSNGDVELVVAFADGKSNLLRYNSGDFSSPAESLPVIGASRGWAFDNRFGSLWEVSEARGVGLYIWKEGKLDLLIRYSSSKLDGTAVESVTGAVFDDSGRVIVSAILAGKGMIIARLNSDGPEVSVREGDGVVTDARPSITAIIGGASIGPVHLLVGGASDGSIALANSDGQITSLLSAGARLPDGTLFNGVSSGFTQWSVRKDADGQIYFVNSHIYHFENGQPQSLFPNVFSNLVFPNSKGDVAFVGCCTRLGLASRSDPFLLGDIFNSSQSDITTINGYGRVLSFSGIGLDDLGRIMCGITFENGLQTVGLWDGAGWRIIAVIGTTELAGRKILGLELVRSKGEHLYASFILTGSSTIAEWNGSNWTVLFEPGFKLPNGLTAPNIHRFEANRNGDIAISGDGPFAYVAVYTKTGIKLVYDSVDRTPEEYFSTIDELDFRDDGTLYFLTYDAYDRQHLFAGKPL